MSDPWFERTRQSLLLRLQNTNEKAEWNSAWERFYYCYIGMIHAWCRRWGLNEVDAEDIGAAVMAILGTRMKSFDYDPSHRFRGWLKTVVENEIKAFLIRRKKRPGDYGKGSLGEDEGATLESIDPAAEAERLAEELEEKRLLLRRAMEQVQKEVQPQHWQAFYLMAVEGHDGKNTAEKLQMSVANVYKARSRVQQLLHEAVERFLADSHKTIE
jgi:RNA polymerase sigma-70 factor (ECF subfamily)